MKVVYFLTSDQKKPLSESAVRECLLTEGATLTFLGPGQFRLQVEEATVEVAFKPGGPPLENPAAVLSGTEEARRILREAEGAYLISIEPGRPLPSVGLFEALLCARGLLQEVRGVLVDEAAFKLHEAADVEEMCELDFDIRDHVSLHAVETGEQDRLWIHSHGMEKFGCLNVEAFHLGEEDLPAAESFFHQLLTDMVMGNGPALGTPVETGEGGIFQLVRSEEARSKLMGIDVELFEGHEGSFLTVVSMEGRHILTHLLRPYRGHFEEETDEQRLLLYQRAKALLPAFKARFFRRGLMEPLTFLVRAPFETHPETEPEAEHLWAEVLDWGDEALTGKLVEGSSHTTEWRKGIQVEIAEGQVNALAISRGGRPLDEGELSQLLSAERPS